MASHVPFHLSETEATAISEEASWAGSAVSNYSPFLTTWNDKYIREGGVRKFPDHPLLGALSAPSAEKYKGCQLVLNEGALLDFICPIVCECACECECVSCVRDKIQ